MKSFRKTALRFAIAGLLVLAMGCAATRHMENQLLAAGFKVVTAKTPAQEQRLRALPSGKITAVPRNGKTYYVFPDASHNRIFLGTKSEYQNYKQMVLDSKIAAQDRIDDEMAPVNGDDWNDWDSWEIITFTPN